MRLLLLVPVLAVLAACAAPAGGAGADRGSASSGAADPATVDRPENDLTVVVDRGDGSPPEEYTLVCAGQVEGTHPDAQAACDHLTGLEDPFAPLPDDAICTEQYGGPQTARVSGRWQGAAVDLELSRTDGCRIAQWDGLGPLLPGPVGVAPPS